MRLNKKLFAFNSIVDMAELYFGYFGVLSSSLNLPISVPFQSIMDLNPEVISKTDRADGDFDYYLLFGNEEILIRVMQRNKSEIIKNINIKYNYQKGIDSPIYKLCQANLREETNIKQLDFISSGSNGLCFRSFEYPDFKGNIDLNYNDDFKEVNRNIIENLNKDQSGLYLLHGAPGTGKTSYIKYLINNINKRFIYCPSFMVQSISSPEFITLMLNHGKDSILIIEDAEEVLLSRETGRNGSVSNILNLGDGLMGDVANIQIIATFNTDLANIDSALIRKGRTVSKYEFKELEISKVEELSKSIGLNFKAIVPMTIAEVYNYTSEDYTEKKKTKIGL